MTRTAAYAGSALALWLAAGTASAQNAPPPVGAPASGQVFRAKSVLGTRVSIQGNVGIGTVDDIVFSDTGMVEYLLVVNEGRIVSVPWDAARFNFEQRTAVVNITPEVYRTIPTFAATAHPNFYAPTYRQQVYRYYGLTPGQERRLERREGVRP